MILYLCSTPWSRTVSIGALVILLVLVFEWEHTDSVVLGHAWVGDSAARLGSGEVERVCLAGSESEGENDEASHDDELWRCSTQNWCQPCFLSLLLNKRFLGFPSFYQVESEKSSKFPEISNGPVYEEECTQENVWFNSLIKVYDTASTHRSQPAILNCCRLLQISNNQTWQTSRVFEG